MEVRCSILLNSLPHRCRPHIPLPLYLTACAWSFRASRGFSFMMEGVMGRHAFNTSSIPAPTIPCANLYCALQAEHDQAGLP